MSAYAVESIAIVSAAALATKDDLSRIRFLRTIRLCLKDVRAAKS